MQFLHAVFLTELEMDRQPSVESKISSPKKKGKNRKQKQMECFLVRLFIQYMSIYYSGSFAYFPDLPTSSTLPIKKKEPIVYSTPVINKPINFCPPGYLQPGYLQPGDL